MYSYHCKMPMLRTCTHTKREATHNVKDEVIDYVQYTEDRGWGKSNLLLYLTLHPSLAPRYPSIF